MGIEDVIVTDREILGGMPVFAKTRVPVQTLIDYLKKQYTIEEFLDDFPTVAIEQARIISATFLEEGGGRRFV